MNKREAQYKVLDLIINRWSPRAMSGEKVSKEELMSLFEAARWAPSSFNNQPWRFIYTTRDKNDQWQNFFDLLDTGNQEWAKNAWALVLAISYKYFEYNKKPSRTHSLDTGSAAQNFLLQGFYMGLVVHPIEGFNYDNARKTLKIPEDYQIEAMYVVGKPGQISVLSEKLKKKETYTDRKKIEEFVFTGEFGKKLGF